MRRSYTPLLLIAIPLALWVCWRLWWSKPQALVVYCAHDAVFAQPLLERFYAETGIIVRVRFDSEATKSLGLVERLIAGAPECDVFWNNEVLGTMDLARRGLLAPHRGPGWQRIPARFRDPEGRWAGFAARLRVEAHHTAVGATAPWSAPPSLEPARGAMAKPLFGTTLTHYCALWVLHGGDAVRAWHTGLRRDGLREVDGNALVRRAVADGERDWGYTDTDDAFEALDDGKPLRFQPARAALRPAGAATGPTIAIPNSIAILASAPHPEAARRLADWLLSAAAEEALATSAARQIPLGAVDPVKVPAAVRALMPALEEAIPLDERMLTARDQVLAWLKREYAP